LPEVHGKRQLFIGLKIGGLIKFQSGFSCLISVKIPFNIGVPYPAFGIPLRMYIPIQISGHKILCGSVYGIDVEN
jgi:hypothetical protein